MITAPKIADLVHYVSWGTPVLPDGTQAFPPQCRAAIVTALPDVQVPEGNVVSLAVFSPQGTLFQEGCMQDEGHRSTQDGPYPEGLAPGTWHGPGHLGGMDY